MDTILGLLIQIGSRDFRSLIVNLEELSSANTPDEAWKVISEMKGKDLSSLVMKLYLIESVLIREGYFSFK